MKIVGSKSYVKFDLENGYVVKAEGEMLIDGKFVVYKNTMRFWEPPHEKEELSLDKIEEIVIQVQKNADKNTVQLIFE